jgi:glycosyltransferase involved in cell wall biosynthesis/predicted RNase H-like HicB family nuclease
MERIIDVKIEKQPDGVYLATSDDVPGLVAHGRTEAEALEMARDVARKLFELEVRGSGALRCGREGTLSPTVKPPLVSILIPAYSPRFFREAFGSAVCQDYPNLEIIVGDDSLGTEIRQIVDRMPRRDSIRYVRNQSNLGFSGNFSQCLKLATAEYIKFLNDDDILHPSCVSTMISRFIQYGERVKLVSSKRRRIDEHNQPLSDAVYTQSLAVVESRMRGNDLGNFVLKNSTNFIGEPPTAAYNAFRPYPTGCVMSREDAFRKASPERFPKLVSDVRDLEPFPQT